MTLGHIPGKRSIRISLRICRAYRLKGQCLGRTAQKKKFSVTYYREEYERNNRRVQSQRGRNMKAKRQGTVEPILSTLAQFIAYVKSTL